MKMNKKGFTLIEMLVVIAIIAVLVSIVIPVVGNSTEKAKEAADAANIRAYIAQVTTEALTGTPTEIKYNMTQDSTFETEDLENIGGFDISVFEVAKGTEINIDYCDDCNGVTVEGKLADGTACTH